MSEQTANLCTTDACESLRARLAKYEDAEGRPVSTIAEQALEIERLKRSAQTNWNEFAEGMKAQPIGVAPTALIEALKYYANGDHLLLADPDAWETCSGEPMNFLHDAAGTASVEDGSIAKAALESLNSSPVSLNQCKTCQDSGVVSTTDKDHNGDHIEQRCPACAGEAFQCEHAACQSLGEHHPFCEYVKQVSAGGVDDRAAFKNFHRSLCDRFGYEHDEQFWWRDLISLEEWIARAALAQSERVPEGWRPVPVESLSNILRLIDPEPVRLPNGDTMVFKNPHAAAALREISAEFRAMLAAAPSAGSQGGDV